MVANGKISKWYSLYTCYTSSTKFFSDVPSSQKVLIEPLKFQIQFKKEIYHCGKWENEK